MPLYRQIAGVGYVATAGADPSVPMCADGYDCRVEPDPGGGTGGQLFTPVDYTPEAPVVPIYSNAPPPDAYSPNEPLPVYNGAPSTTEKPNILPVPGAAPTAQSVDWSSLLSLGAAYAAIVIGGGKGRTARSIALVGALGLLFYKLSNREPAAPAMVN